MSILLTCGMIWLVIRRRSTFLRLASLINGLVVVASLVDVMTLGGLV